MKMAKNYPEDEAITGRNVEGTVAHGIGEFMINNPDVATALVDTLDPSTGTLITAEMVEGATLYAVDVLQFREDTIANAAPQPPVQPGEPEPPATYIFSVEERLNMIGIHPEMFGTPDAFLVDFARKRIYIWDFKYGFSVVEAFKNWQMICYVYGVASYMAKHNASISMDWTVEMRIVQPRAFHEDGPKRSWVTTIEALQPYFDRLKAAALEVSGDLATCRTGKHCRYCPARHACPTLQANASSAAEYSGTPTPELLTGEALAIELSILTDAQAAIDYRLSGLTVQAEQAIRSGERLPGWSIQRTKGREKWTDAAKAAAMAKMMGIDITKPDYLTPKQSRDAGLAKEIVATCSERGAGSAKLKPDDKNKINRIFK